MGCGCGKRAVTLLERIGYQRQEDTNKGETVLRLPETDIAIPERELERRHFRLTLYGLWKFLTARRDAVLLHQEGSTHGS